MVLTLPWKLTISLTFFSSTLSSLWKLTLVRILCPEETRNRCIIPRKRSTGNTKMGTFSKICVSVTLLLLSSTSIHLNSALWFWVGLGLRTSISTLPSRSPLHQQGVPEGTCKARGRQETCSFLFLPASPRGAAAVCFRSQLYFTLPEPASSHFLSDASTDRAAPFPRGSEFQLLGLLAVITPTCPFCSRSSSDGGCFLSPSPCSPFTYSVLQYLSYWFLILQELLK